MKAFTAWRDANVQIWHDYTHHPFVEGLGNGTLRHEAFLKYLVQDYLFLIHFARAWALATVKADTLEEMQAASATVHALLQDEMSLHVGLCAAAGISEPELRMAEEHPANLAYTRYVLEAGYSGDFLDLLAALAPCVMGYGEIGARLLANDDDTPYRDWIETYGSAGYQKLCADTAALIDKAIETRLGPCAETSPRWQSLSRRFGTATRLEVAFWSIAD